MTKNNPIDDYIAAQPEEVQPLLTGSDRKNIVANAHILERRKHHPFRCL